MTKATKNYDKLKSDWENGKVLALFYVVASMIINRLFDDEGIEAILMIISTILITLLRPFVTHTYNSLLDKHVDIDEVEELGSGNEEN